VRYLSEKYGQIYGLEAATLPALASPSAPGRR
jgi:hypothetical protein